MKARQRDNKYSRPAHPRLVYDAELKSLLCYIPRTQKARARELVLWLFPRFRAEKTWQTAVEWLLEKASFWEKPSELRQLGVFVDLLDKIARRNRVRQKHPPVVEDLVWEVCCWYGRKGRLSLRFGNRVVLAAKSVSACRETVKGGAKARSIGARKSAQGLRRESIVSEFHGSGGRECGGFSEPSERNPF